MWGKAEVSDSPLNLRKVKAELDGEFSLDVHVEPECTRHTVEVGKVRCTHSSCDLQMLRNERVYFL